MEHFWWERSLQPELCCYLIYNTVLEILSFFEFFYIFLTEIAQYQETVLVQATIHLFQLFWDVYDFISLFVCLFGLDELIQSVEGILGTGLLFGNEDEHQPKVLWFFFNLLHPLKEGQAFVLREEFVIFRFYIEILSDWFHALNVGS